MNKVLSANQLSFVELDTRSISTEQLFEIETPRDCSWVGKTLEDVCDKIFAGGDVPKSHVSKVRTDECVIPIFANGERDKGLWGYTSVPGVKEPSLTVSARGTIGYCQKRSEEFYPAIRLIVLTPNRKIIDLDYLYYFITSLDFAHSGTSIPQLTVPMIKNYPIPIPPFSEQKRIVAILDEAFAAIETAKANTEKNLKNARELFESYLNDVFSRRGEGWVEKRLGDSSLLTMVDGDRGNNYPKSTDFMSDGYCLFMSTKNVRPHGFDFDAEKSFISEEKDMQLRKGKLQRGDVVMTTRGTIGNIGLYSNEVEYENIRINSGMLIFRVEQKQILPSFLFELLRSAIVKRQIAKYTSGAAQPQLPIMTLSNFTIPVPACLKEQEAHVALISRLQTNVQQLESINQQKLTALDSLKKSLFHQAFSGEL